ncbi:hypothetical protein BH10PSE19_BH10PSE19_03310 [soil metagenome]
MCIYTKCLGRISGSLLGGLTLVGLLALGLGAYTSTHYSGNSEATAHTLQKKLASGTVFPQPREIQAFNLTDETGKAFTNKELTGHWTLLFFGFTRCQDICPTTLAVYNKIYQALQTQKVTEPQFVMVSVDPERDSSKQLNQYVKGFNDAFKAATGEKAVLEKLTKDMSVLYMKVANKGSSDSKDYTIDHSGTIMLIGPNAKLYAVFPMPHDADSISKDFASITAHYGTTA